MRKPVNRLNIKEEIEKAIDCYLQSLHYGDQYRGCSCEE